LIENRAQQARRIERRIADPHARRPLPDQFAVSDGPTFLTLLNAVRELDELIQRSHTFFIFRVVDELAVSISCGSC
jgi:hypothetical protein